MSFEKGSVSFSVFKSNLKQEIVDHPVQAKVEGLAKHLICSVDTIPPEGCVGWATGRHMMDVQINEDSVVIAGHLRATLVKAEKKIPSSLFKTECKQEEMAEMAASGQQFLKRQVKAEIAIRVKENLFPQMPPTFTGIDIVNRDATMYATATSDAQADLLTATWKTDTNEAVYQYSPILAALLLRQFDVRSLTPTSFSPDVQDADLEQDIGTEFLTWLWYFSEVKGGVHGEFGYALEGAFTFVHAGSGAHEIVIRKGNPGNAKEVKAALMAGKKLKKAKLTIARGEDMWTCMIDGSTWKFGSMKLPKGEALDPVSSFQQRILFIDTFVQALEALFQEFLTLRIDEKSWLSEVEAIKQWISDKVGMA